MEQLEKIKAWLMQFPLWGEAEMAVDATGAQPGCCGLFPQGMEQLAVRQNVLGGRRARCRQKFLLRRSALKGQDAAAWLLDFQNWVAENCGAAPAFGENQTVRAEKGRLVNAAQTGAGLYEVSLTVEFTMDYEGE